MERMQNRSRDTPLCSLDIEQPNAGRRCNHGIEGLSQCGSGVSSLFWTPKTVKKDPIFTCISQLSRERRRFKLHQAHIRNPLIEMHNSARDDNDREQILHGLKWKWSKFTLTKTRFSLCSPQWLHGLRHNKQTKVYPRGASQSGTIHSA